MEKLYKEYSYSSIPFYVFEECQSTNTALKEWASAHPDKTKAVFIAKAQSGGRGRLGKSFVSQRGGLYISFLIRSNSTCSDPLYTTTDTAVKLCQMLEELTNLSPKIKWVNDIYLSGKKLSGILTEGVYSPSGEIDFMIIGIGLNIKDISHIPEIADIATSLESECDGNLPTKEAIVKVLTDKIYNGEYALNKEYINRSLIVGKRLTVNDFNTTYTAVAQKIEDDLSLTVTKENGERVNLKSADVSIKIG